MCASFAFFDWFSLLNEGTSDKGCITAGAAVCNRLSFLHLFNLEEHRVFQDMIIFRLMKIFNTLRWILFLKCLLVSTNSGNLVNKLHHEQVKRCSVLQTSFALFCYNWLSQHRLPLRWWVTAAWPCEHWTPFAPGNSHFSHELCVDEWEGRMVLIRRQASSSEVRFLNSFFSEDLIISKYPSWYPTMRKTDQLLKK